MYLKSLESVIPDQKAGWAAHGIRLQRSVRADRPSSFPPPPGSTSTFKSTPRSRLRLRARFRLRTSARRFISARHCLAGSFHATQDRKSRRIPPQVSGLHLLRTSRYLIRNSSCFTNDCVAADKPSLRVSVWEVFRSQTVTDRTSFRSSANSLLALTHWKMSASAQNVVPINSLATNTAALGSGFFLFRSTSCTRFKIPSDGSDAAKITILRQRAGELPPPPTDRPYAPHVPPSPTDRRQSSR